MGKPRMILLIRHAQSEGNKNRDIHQFIPDHRVKLTQDGWQQAEEAGRRLRSLLRPDDTLQFYTSPYRRTRETTEGILKSLTSDDPNPSPFPRHKIKVYEEPRLREQDFGNFQPCSAEMERMWQERADYGHFFYRIPNGESAADAYDRISGFNESLWRQFGEEDFPSVCVLVTHGLMTRVFLMKWYHWSVEYFEDLRNVNHCEFILMKQNLSNGRFILENEMRTWSDLKRRAAAVNPNTSVAKGSSDSSNIPTRQWGGCVNGCNHAQIDYPRKKEPLRKNTAEYMRSNGSSARAADKEKQAAISPDSKTGGTTNLTALHNIINEVTTDAETPPQTGTEADADNDASSSDVDTSNAKPHLSPSQITKSVFSHNHPHPARDFTSTRSGPITPNELFSEDSDYFPKRQPGQRSITAAFGNEKEPRRRNSSRSSSVRRKASLREAKSKAKTEAGWAAESGMGVGARADTLGDGDGDVEEIENMVEGVVLTEDTVEDQKMRDRKGLSEVY